MTKANHRFLGISALFFVACAAITVTWCFSMSGMGGMPMPGGWTMSMTWMLMPGQSWHGAAASFVGMWFVMMVAMMLPSLTPTLWRYRQALSEVAPTRLDLGTALVAIGYFSVWTLLGIAVFPLGVALAAIEMRHPGLARAVPLTASVVIVLAGALQFTSWKARQLVCCREVSICACSAPQDARTAFKRGLRLGVRCSACCASLTAVLLVVGVMDLRAMAVLTAAISLERLMPATMKMAHAIGVVAVGVGLVGLLQGAGWG